MRCVLLGTGTSHGIPVIGCKCECCVSCDSKDKRLRSSLWVTDEGDINHPAISVLIDIGPDFRQQALKFSITRLDALLLTHSHADHLNGLDDIRIFSHTCSMDPPEENGEQRVYPETNGNGIPVLGNKQTLKDLRKRFSYVFKPVSEGGGKPKLHTVECSAFSAKNPFVIGRVGFVPVPLKHGSLDDTGWIITQGNNSVAYLTDCSFIPETSLEILHCYSGNLRHLVIDGLRVRPHTTHFSFEQALKQAVKIKADCTWLTHICHDMTHVAIQKYLEQLIFSDKDLHPLLAENRTCGPAYDGLILSV